MIIDAYPIKNDQNRTELLERPYGDWIHRNDLRTWKDRLAQIVRSTERVTEEQGGNS